MVLSVTYSEAIRAQPLQHLGSECLDERLVHILACGHSSSGSKTETSIYIGTARYSALCME